MALGPGRPQNDPTIQLGGLVGVRFSSRICRRCEFCLSGQEQYCSNSTNHLHHEDGAFQEYIALDADYLTILPNDCDPVVMGPVLCAGLTAYKVCWLLIITISSHPAADNCSRRSRTLTSR